ncbi:MAG TPA: hypothetical protein VMK30_04045 [Pleomorphomonadaceae bacterium]|nr:hypothetical protein [Pleomorphomonadaceae bacterium]
MTVAVRVHLAPEAIAQEVLDPVRGKQSSDVNAGPHAGDLTQQERAEIERGDSIAHARESVPWPEVAEQLNETVIRRVIQYDLRLGERGRKRDPQLL